MGVEDRECPVTFTSRQHCSRPRASRSSKGKHIYDKNEQKIKVFLPQNDKSVSANWDPGLSCAQATGDL